MPDLPPNLPEKHAWRRRYTDVVNERLALPGQPTPSEAGGMASEQVRAEWVRQFPGAPVPDWMP